MRRLHLLGYSENVLALVLETVHVLQQYASVVVVRNVSVPEEMPFLPEGLEVQVIDAADWAYTPGDPVSFGVATPAVKKKVFEFFRDTKSVQEEDYINIIHPASTIASTVRLERGIYIEPGTVVSPFAELRFGVVLNRGVTIGHHTQLGAFSTINPGVHIAGNCVIGPESQVGIGALVFNKTNIGRNSLIGGGSVVTSAVPDGVVAWGNPCKVIRPSN